MKGFTPPEFDTSLAGNFARDFTAFNNAAAAVARITEIYDRSVAAIRTAFAAAARGGQADRVDANYPYIVVPISRSDLHVDARLSWGVLLEAGTYGTTLTRPDLFARYYEEQIGYLLKHHEVPVHVGVSNRPIPLPFVIEESVTDITEADLRALQAHFALPDLSATDDSIANGTFVGAPGEPRPLALFTAERVDYSLARLQHYTGTSPEHFQNFVLLTNYQRYVDGFIALRPRSRRQGRLFRLRRAGQHDASGNAARLRRPGTGLAALPAADARLSPEAREQRRHHARQYRRRAVERQDHHRPHRGAPPGLLADARPLRGPAAQPAARRLRAGARLCARRPRARPGPSDLGAGAADRRGAGRAAAGDRDGHRPCGPGHEDARCAPARSPPPTTATGSFASTSCSAA